MRVAESTAKLNKTKAQIKEAEHLAGKLRLKANNIESILKEMFPRLVCHIKPHINVDDPHGGTFEIKVWVHRQPGAQNCIIHETEPADVFPTIELQARMALIG
jgi:hypothetical protein